MRYAVHTLSFEQASLLQKKWALYTAGRCVGRITESVARSSLLRIDWIDSTPDPDTLGTPATMAIDQRGRIYAVSSRTGAIHVFDPEGTKLHVCRPAPEDVPKKLWQPTITINDEGEVSLAVGKESWWRYVRFSPDGTRKGIQTLRLDSIKEHWHDQPGSTNRWILGYGKAWLVDSSGKPTVTLSRRPDGKWFEALHRASVAPDGSIAIIATPSRLRNKGPLTLNLYSPKGDAIRTLMLPSSLGRFPTLAHGGDLLVLSGKGIVIGMAPSGAQLFSFKPEEGAADVRTWLPMIAKEGRVLLLFDGESPVLRRYHIR